MKNVLIFRTDRIGDFLISAILLKCIKINDPSSQIILVSSTKNYSYIKNFPFVDEVIKLENNFLSKINVILKLRKKKFNNIIIHDNKKRSKFISYFLNKINFINIDNPNNYSHIEIIKKILYKMNFQFYKESLNIFSHNNDEALQEEKFIQLHFDEKWIHKDYIKKYLNIEPNENQLIEFIRKIVVKSDKKLVITTGIKLPNIMRKIIPQISGLNVEILENLDFKGLEEITLNASTLISCHGSISHIAAAKNIKQIDIIDKSYNYSRWTDHFRNYNFIYRNKINLLLNDIIQKI